MILFIYIYILWVSGLGVCLYPINVKTAEPTGRKFFCGTSCDPRVGLWIIEFQKFASNKLYFFNFENTRFFLYNSRNFLFVFVLQCI